MHKEEEQEGHGDERTKGRPTREARRKGQTGSFRAEVEIRGIEVKEKERKGKVDPFDI